VSPDRLAALGAFLSGVGAVVSSVAYAKLVRKRADQECEKRLQAFKDGLHERDPR